MFYRDRHEHNDQLFCTTSYGFDLMNNLILSGRITIRMLKYFMAVAENEHFGKAAEQLNVSKSPLSIKIRELEDALETTLFVRDSRNVKLTPTGMLLKEECNRIFDVLSSSVNNIIKAERNQKNIITIGLVSSAFWTDFLTDIRQFQKSYPSYEFNFIEMSPAEQKESLLNSTIDIGVSRHADTFNIHPLSSIELTRESMLVAIPEDHPFKNRKLLDLAELKNEKMVAMARSRSAQTELVIQKCMEHDFHPMIHNEVKEPHTMLAFVAARQSIAIVPASFKYHKWNHVRLIPLSEYIPAGLVILYNNQKSSPITDHFIDNIVSIKS